MWTTEAILESISDSVFTIDHDWHVTSFNRPAERITGVQRVGATDRKCWDVSRSSMCEADCTLRRTMKTVRPIICRAGYIATASGKRVPVSVSTTVLRYKLGRIIVGAEPFHDLSEVEPLRKEVEARSMIGELVSHNPALQSILEALPAITASPSTVLICG
ncbi:MAG: PAS domain S-box protein [candidate division WOR-3 bacterium]